MTGLDLFEYVAPLVSQAEMKPSMSLQNIVNDVTWMLTKKLWKLESDLLQTVTDGSVDYPDLQFAEGVATADVPGGFLGFAAKPYIVGESYTLNRFNREAHAIYDGETGSPLYFDVRDNKIHLVPIPDSAIALRLNYFAKPDSVTDLANDIPFTPLFDEVYKEAAILIHGKLQSIATDKDFLTFLENTVSEVLEIRSDPQSCFVRGAYS